MDTDEKLIYLVRKYDCLFNTKAKYYSDKTAKTSAWKLVSNELKLPVADCQKRWKELRDCYKKALRLRQYKSCSSRKNLKPIKFEKELEFLIPHLQDKPRTTNLDCPEETLDMDIQSIATIAPPRSINIENPRQDTHLPNPSTPNNSEPLSHILLRQYIKAKEKEEDPLDGFFLSMSRSVKKMPIQIQAELKRAILNLVTDAEIKLACEETNGTSSYIVVGTQQQQPPNITRQSFHTPSSYTPSSSNFYQTEPSSTSPTEIVFRHVKEEEDVCPNPKDLGAGLG